MKLSSFVQKGCFLLILGPISALMGQNTFVNTLIPAPLQFFATGAFSEFDTLIVDANNTLIPAQAVPIIASLLNPRKKNFPRKEKFNQAKRRLYLDVGLVKFAEEGYDMEMRGDRLWVRVANYGGAATALEGIGIIESLVAASKGRIQILAGAGINRENVAAFSSIAGLEGVHTTAKRLIQDSGVASGPLWESDADEIRAIKAVIG